MSSDNNIYVLISQCNIYGKRIRRPLNNGSFSRILETYIHSKLFASLSVSTSHVVVINSFSEPKVRRGVEALFLQRLEAINNNKLEHPSPPTSLNFAVLQFIRVFTSFSPPQADIGHLDLLESSLNLAFTSTSSINSVNAYHNPKSNMESTGRKRRVADVESDVGSKRSKQADGQQPLGGIETTNSLEMAFIGAGTEGPRGRQGRRPDERASIQEYPSIQDIDRCHPVDLKIVVQSDVTLQTLMRPCISAGGSVVKTGDIVTFRVFGDLIKKIEITHGNGKHTMSTPQGPVVLQYTSLMISVPRGAAQDLNGPNGNVAFPNDVSRDRICSPTAIWKAARSEYPPGTIIVGTGRDMWENMHVTRDGEELGTLHELRLALQFSMNEADFAAQLTFCEVRDRRATSKGDSNAAKAGFHMVNSGTLFLKVPEDAVQGLNQDLLIDLGEDLNEKLAALAEDGYSIVLVDSRGSHADGLPMPDDDECLENALVKGPEAFPTAYTRRIAGYSGWSNGRAHMSFPSLCRDDRVETEIPAPFQYLYRTPGMQGKAPPIEEQVVWTKEETKSVGEFYSEEMEDQIRHYPLPLTRSRRPLHIRTMQYRKSGDGWIVDSRAHPEIHNNDVFTDRDFDEAMTKPRTRAVQPRRKAKKFKDDGISGGGANWAGYETLGRIVPDKSGRHATLEARFEGYEDN
ncbi:hypothetical protein BKA65DRAFT_485797 [Rhexocercosporidium sp. MPI-PUGE-AT-0058]|nr:hypothetical protein BKA65DRAFT_485797 [Rhexocercosporidium sp. MPI-PUGE-AT-0058]